MLESPLSFVRSGMMLREFFFDLIRSSVAPLQLDSASWTDEGSRVGCASFSTAWHTCPEYSIWLRVDGLALFAKPWLVLAPVVYYLAEASPSLAAL